jgi:hypothetical protein
MNNKYTNTGQLPDNPLEMPPPYWRSPGIVFQLTICLEELSKLLTSLLDIHPQVNALISDYFDQNPEPEDDDPEFGEICGPLWEIESKIILKTELAIFMAAIQAEDHLNQIITYNLHKDIADTIEKLSPPEKLMIISANLTSESVKGSRPYDAIKSLSKWRNSYAHGHCTDRPTKSLRHNHLVAPEEYPSVPKAIENMLYQLNGYLELSNYLRKISHNEYTIAGSTHDTEIKNYLNEIDRYQFSYEEDGQVYDLEY